MAYASSRGSSGRSSRGGGSNNMTAYAVAVVLLILVVVLVMVLGKKKEPPPARPSTPVASAPPPTTTGPVKPAEAPYPPVPEATLAKGRDLVKTFDQDLAKANELYQESQKAKKAGDDTAWQSKLKDARKLAEGINDRWNAFIVTLPHSKDYDEEQVAKHYFYKESGIAAKTGKLLAAMKSDER